MHHDMFCRRSRRPTKRQVHEDLRLAFHLSGGDGPIAAWISYNWIDSDFLMLRGLNIAINITRILYGLYGGGPQNYREDAWHIASYRVNEIS